MCVGAGPDGQHCCQVDGADCEALVHVGGVPQCSFMLAGEPMLGNPEWEWLPVGRHFAVEFPGFDCADWPQNIPEVMGNPALGKCCWEG